MVNLHLKIYLKNNTKFSVLKSDLGKWAKEVFIDLDKAGNFQIFCNIVGEEKIKKLNYKYRKINLPTDVLSFGQIDVPGEKMKFIGDIFICPKIAQKNAKIYKLSLQEELQNLFKHGIKHLLGFHHK